MSLLAEWKQWDHTSKPYVLNGDKSQLDKDGAQKRVARYDDWRAAAKNFRHDDHRLHIHLIPQPFVGDLTRASIFLLMNNPGLGPDAYFEHEHPALRSALLANLKQETSDGALAFWPLDPQFAEYSGFCYWHNRLREVIAQIAVSKNIAWSAARKEIAEQLAVIQAVPYHSARIPRIGRLKSTELAREYVREQVVPRVKKGEALVLVLRDGRTWEPCLEALKDQTEHVIIYERTHARVASLGKDSPGGSAILRHVGVLGVGAKPIGGEQEGGDECDAK